MINFLQNLIDRHQVDNGDLPARHIVQPRPQSRFENDSGFLVQDDSGSRDEFAHETRPETEPGLSPSQIAPQNESLLTTSKAARSNQQTATQPNRNHSGIASGHMREEGGREEGINERIDALALSIEQKTIEQKPFEQKTIRQKPIKKKSSMGEIPVSAVSNKSFPLAEQQTESLLVTTQRTAEHEVATQANSQNVLLTDDLSQRIQSILQRIDNQQPQSVDNQSIRQRLNNQPPVVNNASIEPRGNTVLANADNNTHTGSQEQSLVAEPILAATEKGRAQNQGTDAQPEQQLHQTGLLQIPSWLTEMRAELHNRWREDNKQVEAEPVINVTIGRVEVKAVQTGSAKQSKARKKPSGVMTLDDYLKQRDHRGHA